MPTSVLKMNSPAKKLPALIEPKTIHLTLRSLQENLKKEMENGSSLQKATILKKAYMDFVKNMA